MNCVPGMTTEFHLETDDLDHSMRIITNKRFEYVPLCNKICRVAHP